VWRNGNDCGELATGVNRMGRAGVEETLRGGRDRSELIAYFAVNVGRM
jgi:hypothetical protein